MASSPKDIIERRESNLPALIDAETLRIEEVLNDTYRQDEAEVRVEKTRLTATYRPFWETVVMRLLEPYRQFWDITDDPKDTSAWLFKPRKENTDGSHAPTDS